MLLNNPSDRNCSPLNDRTSSRDTPTNTVKEKHDVGVSVLGKEPNRLVQAIRDIRHCGIEKLNIPLPKICVVGDQSTGKSSLIEGLSGIKVPRGGDTCTRCPLEINLTHTEENIWHCRVYIVLKYTWRPNKTQSSTSKDTLHPWVENATIDTVSFGEILIGESGRARIANILQRAQRAILNPDKNPELFLVQEDAKVPKGIKAHFSPNIVRLDISASDLPDLSLYDLPGVIVNMDDTEDPGMPKLVEQLVKDYIGAESCVVLQTMTMNNDAMNSRAAAVVREENAQKRTLGILTKPDLASTASGAATQWKDMLDGKRFKLGWGYHVVLNDPLTETEHTTARDKERDFFNTNELFTGTGELSQYRDRLGTPKLQHRLSDLLATEIKERLPGIEEQIHTTVKTLRMQLSTFPQDHVGNTSLIVMETARKFGQELKRAMDGGNKSNPFFTDWYLKARNLHHTLVESRPALLMSTPPKPRDSYKAQAPAYHGKKTSVGHEEPINLDNDDEPQMFTPTPVAGTKRHYETSTPINNTKRARLNPQLLAKLALIPAHTTRQDNQEIMESCKAMAKKFRLPEIRNLIDMYDMGLAGIPDITVVRDMLEQSTGHWKHVIDKFFEDTRAMYKFALKECLKRVLMAWKGVPLAPRLWEISNSFATEALDKLEQQMTRLLEIEHSRPITTNVKLLEEKQPVFKRELVEHYHECRKKEIARALGLNEVTSEVDERVRAVENKCDQELEVMALTRGYYYVAAQRLADNITQATCFDLFSHTRDNMLQYIINELQIEAADANNRCTELLKVDFDIAIERERVQEQLKAAEAAQRTLESLRLQTHNESESYDDEDEDMNKRGRGLISW